MKYKREQIYTTNLRLLVWALRIEISLTMVSKLLIFTLCVLIYSVCSFSWSGQALDLDRELASEGYITISWKDRFQSAPNTIQVALDASFTQLVREIKLIDQESVHLSGFDNGMYYVRLIETHTNQASQPSTFTVQHRNLSDALKFFSLGMILFVLLIFMLTRFNYQSD